MPTDISSVLFKTQDMVSFSIDDLFKEQTISKSLIPIGEPACLKMTPRALYAQIRELANKRYGVELPEDQKSLLCLGNSYNKISLLRDVCIKIGVKVNQGAKDFILDNDTQVLHFKL